MISASHNPPEDNGIKIFGTNGAKLPQLVQSEIEEDCVAKPHSQFLRVPGDDTTSNQS